MSRLRVHSFSISIDGYGAGPSQDLQNPLGVGGPALFDWFFHTRTWRRMHGSDGGETSDELHLAIAPVLLGTGEHLLHGIDMRASGYERVEHVAGARAAVHVILRKGES